MMAPNRIVWRAVPNRQPSQAQDGHLMAGSVPVILAIRPKHRDLICMVNGAIIGSKKTMSECKRLFDRTPIAEYVL